MNKKLIGKVFLYSLSGLMLLLGVGVALLYTYQDKVIQLFVSEANKHLKTKVQVGQMSLSLFDKFPQVAISLNQVTVTESLAGSSAPLAKAKQLYFTFNVLDLLADRYRVREVFLEEGQVWVKFLPDGTANYWVFTSDSTRKTNKEFLFLLEKIHLKNIRVTYTDQRRHQAYKVLARQMQAGLRVTDKQIDVEATGKAIVQTLRIDKDDYFQNKEVAIQTNLVINRVADQVRIMPSIVRVGAAQYQIAGTTTYKGPINLDLSFTGKNTTIHSLLALLPAKYSRPFGEYQSQGKVYFNGTVKGITSGKANPQVFIQFGCRNASFYHPASKQKLEQLNLQGHFTNGISQNSLTSVVELKNIKGYLRNKPFTGTIIYRNLQDPFLQVKLKGQVEVGPALEVFRLDNVSHGNGVAALDIAFAGKMRSFQSRVGYGQVSSAGEINLKNVSFRVKNYPQAFRQLNGNFIFRKSDLAVSDFTGKLGSSDFKLNGYFKNVLGWLFLSKQRLLVEADFTSDFLNFDELLSEPQATVPAGIAANKQRRSKAPAYKLVVSPYFDFDINTSVRRLQFRRFIGKNMAGTLRLKNQVISSPSLALNIIGGRFGINGLLDARKPNNIQVTTLTTVNNIRLDSLFYVFENFGQQFLVQRHLRGELTASIHSDLYFTSHLQPQTNRMEAEIDARIRNGQLIHFEPMQKLSPFIDKRELADLRFSELSNKFWIQERTVYIPEMEVRSNVSKASVIGIQGTHTFDQQLEYKFRIPLRNKIQRASLLANGLPANDGGSNLFLVLKGNENNYKIAYDKQRVKNKIAQNLRLEKQEFKEVLKGKKPAEQKKTDQPQPAENEYFDF